MHDHMITRTPIHDNTYHSRGWSRGHPNILYVKPRTNIRTAFTAGVDAMHDAHRIRRELFSLSHHGRPTSFFPPKVFFVAVSLLRL